MPDSMIVVAQQHVEALLVEVEHHAFQLALGHLAVGDADARFGHQFLQLLAACAPMLFHFVVQEVHLAAAGEFALERLAQLRVVPGHDEGLHGEAMRRRGSDDREIAQTGHRHVERARDRCGGERDQVHVGAQRLQRFLLAHAETLFLVDDDQAQILEAHVALQQAMGADDRRRSCLRRPWRARPRSPSCS